jgi:hypothetical protein
MMGAGMVVDLDDRSKELVVDVVLLALSRCTHGHVGLAFRSAMRNEKKIFEPEDGGIDLAPVWALLTAQEGIDLESSKPAFQYLKSLESRLGVSVRLPASVTAPGAEDAATTLLKREEFDRFLVAALTRASNPPGARSLPILTRRLTPSPVANGSAARSSEPWPATPTPTRPGMPTATPTPTGAPKGKTIPPPGTKAVTKTQLKAVTKTQLPAVRKPLKPSTKRSIAIGAVVVMLACLWFVLRPALFERKDFKSISPADVTTEMPVAKAQVFGREIHLQLADSGWMKLPEQARTAQLKQALEYVREQGIRSIVVKDKTGKVRATAQWFGNPPEARIRFH